MSAIENPKMANAITYTKNCTGSIRTRIQLPCLGCVAVYHLTHGWRDTKCSTPVFAKLAITPAMYFSDDPHKNKQIQSQFLCFLVGGSDGELASCAAKCAEHFAFPSTDEERLDEFGVYAKSMIELGLSISSTETETLRNCSESNVSAFSSLTIDDACAVCGTIVDFDAVLIACAAASSFAWAAAFSSISFKRCISAGSCSMTFQ